MIIIIKSIVRFLLPSAWSLKLYKLSQQIRTCQGEKAAKRCLSILQRSEFIETEKQAFEATARQEGHPKILWQCWFQGEAEMPELIKKYMAINKPFVQEYRQVIVTFDNMDDYVRLPENILEKYKAGKMSLAHLSDIVRVHLLSKHGGVWLDATVLLTDNIPDYIENADFFCFRSPEGHAISSWFIVSTPYHPLINAMVELLNIYWREYDKLKDYFMLHLLFQAAVTEDAFYKEVFDRTPYDDNPFRADLLFFFAGEDFTENNPYDKQRVETILSSSFIHKMTYKNDLDGIGEVYRQLARLTQLRDCDSSK